LLEKYRITEREKDIILIVSKGFSNKELCDKLFISMASVKTHIRNIYEKTGARNRVELLNLFKK
jgi:DNA-binding CsgD family transcriptional regulator